MAKLHSVYRAWCVGIGNGPHAPLAASGNQYLEADPAVWNEPGLPEDLQAWLTLKVSPPIYESEEVGDRLEGWMAGPFGSWYFVGRLTAFGRDDHDRPAFFAHGRGWREENWRDLAVDPGVLFGDPTAFDAPRLTPLGTTVENAPDVTARIVKACANLRSDKDRTSAARLVAHLFQAIDTGVPVVCVAPIEEFCSRRDLATLVGIARAALPIEERKLARIRLYAEGPKQFLDAGVHLLALLPDHAAAVQSATTTIQFERGMVSGPNADAFYEEYGRSIISRATAYPEHLLRFGASSGRRLQKAFDNGGPPIATSVSTAYEIVRGLSSGELDVLLPGLFDDAAKRKELLAWSELIDGAEWSKVDAKTLATIAVRDAPSPDSRELRQQARFELAKRTLQIDDLIQANWRLTVAHARDIILWTASVKRRSFEPATVRALLHQLSPADARTLLLDAHCGVTFAALVGCEPLPAEWRHDDLFGVAADEAARMIVAVTSGEAVRHWRPWLDRWVVTVAGGEVAADVRGAICDLGGTADDLLVAVAYGDVFAGAGSKSAENHAKMLKPAYPAAEWQALLRRCATHPSPFIDRHVSLAWLLKGVSREDIAPLVSVLDRRIEAGAVDACRELIRADLFGAWLLASASNVRWGAALEWLHSSDVVDPNHDWSDVVKVLSGRLTGADLVKKPFGQKAAIHRVTPSKRLDLAAGVPDLAAAVQLAQIGSPPDYDDVEATVRRHTSLCDGLPDKIVRLVAGAREAASLASARQLEWVTANSGYRSDHVLAVGMGQILRDVTQGAAPLQNATAEFWAREDVRRVGREWIAEHRELTADQLESLREWLPARTPLGLPNARLAGRFASGHELPTINVNSLDAAVVAAANAMANGQHGEPAWEHIAEACRFSAVGDHPLLVLADRLAADWKRHAQYHRHGKAVLERAIAAHRALGDVPFAYDGPLPLFVLLMRTSADLPLEDVALQVIALQRQCRSDGGVEWLRSLAYAMRRSTRLSGTRLPNDTAEVALTRVVAYLRQGSCPSAIHNGMLAQINPLRSARVRIQS